MKQELQNDYYTIIQSNIIEKLNLAFDNDLDMSKITDYHKKKKSVIFSDYAMQQAFGFSSEKS